MGAFGIYALVVTFIFVIYYVVIISMELFGSKGEKKESVEVIHTGKSLDGNIAETMSAASPVRISETGEGRYQIERPGEEEPETYGGEAGKTSSEGSSVLETPEPTGKPLTAEDIAAADAEELARQAKAKADSINHSFTPVTPEIQGSMYADEFKEDIKAALLNARRADEQAELLSD